MHLNLRGMLVDMFGLSRWIGLRNKANSVFFKASMSMEKSYRVIDFVSLSDEAENDEDSESSESDDKMEATTFGPLLVYFTVETSFHGQSQGSNTDKTDMCSIQEESEGISREIQFQEQSR